MAVEPNRWGIIYNPKAGSRKTQKRWNEIRSYMENRKVVFDYVQFWIGGTTRPYLG
jgi:diacylglycerol kinase (ATP)